MPAVVVKDGAHHYDLRGSDPRDTDAVKAARAQEEAIIADWLAAYHSMPRTHLSL